MTTPRPKPNILFLFSDQHTRNVAGCYGDKVVQTPNLDRLAAAGVVFENAYTPSPLCVPARMAMLSARHPSKTACWTNSDVLPSTQPTYAHVLASSQIRPVLIGRLDSIGPDQTRGFAERRIGEHSTMWVGGPAHILGELKQAYYPYGQSLQASGPGQHSYMVKDHDVTAETLRYLDELAKGREAGDTSPFFLQVGMMLPHQPYVCAPEDFDYYIDTVGMPKHGVPKDEHPFMRWWRSYSGIAEVDPADIVRARAAYYGMVTEMDRNIGRILDRLKALGLDDNTLIVYSSDHGDSIGEHGLWWKQTLYEEAVAVPLIMTWAGQIPAGERRRQNVNLIDLATTFCELAGHGFPNETDGRDLFPVAQDGNAAWDNVTVSEYCTDTMAPWAGDRPNCIRMLRRDDWKLIFYHSTRPQLFNLANDPEETDDLAADPACSDILQRLKEELLSDWNPEVILEKMAENVSRKRVLAQWAHAIKPAEIGQWKITDAQNWLRR